MRGVTLVCRLNITIMRRLRFYTDLLLVTRCARTCSGMSWIIMGSSVDLGFVGLSIKRSISILMEFGGKTCSSPIV